MAEAGHLAVPEKRAAQLVHAAGRGVVFSLIGVPEEERDSGLSDAAREAVIAAITTDEDIKGPASDRSSSVTAAITLRAGVADLSELTDGERQLMAEWLDRISASLG